MSAAAEETRGKRALVLINDRSRQGLAGAGAAIEVLQRNGFVLRQETPPGRAELEQTIRRASSDVDLVILGGGDGTLNAASRALVDTGLPLGIIPLGTGNDLARTLALPFEPAQAAAVIADGHLRRIDLGEVNGQPFFNVASIGLSTRVSAELNGDIKKRWGAAAYAIATFKALSQVRPFSAEIRCDGSASTVRTLQIAVGNGRHYGGGLTVDAHASIDDGQLNLYSLEFENLWKLLLVYPAFRKGEHGVWREVRTLTCSEVEVRTRRPKRVNTDGEITTTTPARFRVLRQAVSVFVPR
jgi:YegS/Rv2252/BmrU family lipid kinase